MSNQPYDRARYRALTAALNWTQLDLRLAAFSGPLDFVPADTSLAAIVSRGVATKIGYSLTALNKAVSADGYAKTGPIVMEGVATGQTLSFFVLCIHNPTTENLGEPLLFLDTGMNLPFDTNGLDLVIQPDWLSNRGWWRP